VIGGSAAKQMRELTNTKWTKVQGLLFLLLGIAAAILVIWESPSLKVALLLALVICASVALTFCTLRHRALRGPEL